MIRITMLYLLSQRAMDFPHFSVEILKICPLEAWYDHDLSWSPQRRKWWPCPEENAFQLSFLIAFCLSTLEGRTNLGAAAANAQEVNWMQQPQRTQDT